MLTKGYRPEHIELERTWSLGHGKKGGRADILVSDVDGKNVLCNIECKTYDVEFKKELKNLNFDGGQLFSYLVQEKSTKYLILYASELDGKNVIYQINSVRSFDDPNILELAKKDDSILLFKNCNNAVEAHKCWTETYKKELLGDVIFNEDTVAYKIGVKPLKKKDLKDFSADDKIVNRFEEILRHNNVSDKENAFNRLTALFICKLVDEINKKPNDIVEFQYKYGTDTYETLQDRLQKLHQQGMDKFMREKIIYIADDYACKLVKTYTGSERKKLIEELNKTIKILKFYTNNDFAFKDVHNEELFYQNGKVLVEVVQLFQNFRIINSKDLQLLGDLFEQLLNKGFKQNEGQFFTPIPITRFIARSLPFNNVMCGNDKQYFPKIIDYACGAGHFLTEGFEEVKRIAIKNEFFFNDNWVEHKLFGIEKDYRLSRVSKIMLFMHGFGKGNIVFGDGLDNYPDKEICNETFDVLMANPPYSVSAFKPHLKLKLNKSFNSLQYISNDGSEIEALFVERISQLLKPNGVAAVILPTTILNKTTKSYIAARESILENFYVKAIVELGKNTFGQTGTPTVILFLKKFDYPPKRLSMVEDSLNAIFNNDDLSKWEDNEIFTKYCEEIKVDISEYIDFILKKYDFEKYKNHEYFSRYYYSVTKSTEFKTKINQKSFKKLSEIDKNAIKNDMFYKTAILNEQDKIKIFALVYNQRTLVVIAPEDNKEQKKFLGYSWCNRKGQEGIVIENLGGALFDDTMFDNPDKFSYLINNMYNDNEVTSSKLADYSYFYSNFKDLIDFDNNQFEKVIKLVQRRKRKDDPEYKLYKLSRKDIFDFNIGQRVLKEDLVDEDSKGAIRVLSANINDDFGYINKKQIKDFSKPSILWGIDGNWVVNLIDKNIKFYPTDHCGYLRILNNDVLPEYVRYALEVEGRYQRYSRNNRASMKALQSLSIQIPSKKTQEKIVNILEAYDEIISKLEDNLIYTEQDIIKKFNEYFGSLKADKKIESYFNVEKGESITENEANIDGNIPVVAGGKTSCYSHDKANRPGNIITVSSSGSSGFVNYWKCPIFASDCSTILSQDEQKVSTVYLYYYLKSKQKEIYGLREGLQPSHVYADSLKKFNFPLPDHKKEEEFLKFVKKQRKLMDEINAKIAAERNNKTTAINKYI